MRPGSFRSKWGFVGCGAATLTLCSAVPALAAGLTVQSISGAAPLAMALGAGCFAVLAMLALRKLLREGKLARRDGLAAPLAPLTVDLSGLRRDAP